MRRTGYAYLPLHTGYVPKWLYNRMVDLGEKILYIIIEDFGVKELLNRLADPIWFQALGCVLGFDWHSSGLTTVVTSALKDACRNEDIGIFIAGGKGIHARNTIDEIEGISHRIDAIDKEKIIYTSRIAAKVDNTLLLDGYYLYHHTIFFDEHNNWSIIQQGMNPTIKYARRYHWASSSLSSYVIEPHSGMIGDLAHREVIDLTSRESSETNRVIIDIVKEKDRFKKDLDNMKYYSHIGLNFWIEKKTGSRIKTLAMPTRINWKAIKKAYETQPSNLEELISIRGIGPSTIRALSLISEVIYGVEPSKRDPVRYTFAVGGKDGVPFPIDKDVYDEVISYFDELASKANLERKRIINRLSKLLLYINPIK